MSILRENAQPLIRHVAKYEEYVRPGDDKLLNDAVNTLYGIGDLKLVLDAMIDRYAQYLYRETNADTGVTTTSLATGNIQVRMDNATAAAIRSGQFEVTLLKWAVRVATANASLFSEPDLRYEYDDDTASENMPEIREEGGANMTAQRWDSMACMVKSCALYLAVRGGLLIETEVRPTSIWIVFADMITDGDTDRSTNKNNIDEASLVVMALDGGNFAAWFGPSEMYPNGRHVTYESEKWNDIPLPGTSKSAREYVKLDNGSGDYQTGAFSPESLANPLTLWSVKSNAPSLPVYPFAILYGDPQSVGLMPTSTSLYEMGMEYDVGASLIFGAASKGARGMRILTRAAGADQSIPSNTEEGLIVLGHGQTLTQGGWAPTNSKSAWEVLSDIARQTAEVNHVPGNIALAQPYPLRTATQVLMDNEDRLDFRRKRIEMNRHSVRRRWEIEKALINATTYNTEGVTTIKEDAIELWDPGKMELKAGPAEKVAEWDARVLIGEASILDVIRDMRGFTSDSDALQWATDRKALLEKAGVKEVLDFFKPTPEPAPVAPLGGGGLFGGRR